MAEKIHVFENGVKVYDYHLMPDQRERYKKRNVHEADEEGLFVEIISAIPRDGCFVNVGSAIGYYAILAKKLSPAITIHAVEPLEIHRRYFIENIELNHLSPDEFVVHQEGVSSSEGYTTFLAKRYGSRILHQSQDRIPLTSRITTAPKTLLARLGIRGCEIKSQSTTRIRTITLDKLMDVVGRPADLLQMDVQGLEADIFEGAVHSLQAGLVRTFLVGTHGDEIHQRCIGILRELGYSIEFEEGEPKSQPDGIIVASKAVRRLKVQGPTR